MMTISYTLIRRTCAIFFLLLVLCPSVPAQGKRFTLQIESVGDQETASAVVGRLRAGGIKAYWLKSTLAGRGTFFRVRIGRFSTAAQATKYGEQLKRAGVAKEYFVALYEGGGAPINIIPAVTRNSISFEKSIPVIDPEGEPAKTTAAAVNAPKQEVQNRGMMVESRYWINSSKVFTVFADNINSSDLRLSFAAGLKTKNIPEGRFTWQITRRNKLRFDYLNVTARGEAARLGVNFSGQTFNFDSSAISELEIKQIRFGYAWQGINIRDKIRIGPLVELRGLWFDGSIADQSSLRGNSGKRSASFALPLPTFGADLEITPHRRVDFFAVVSGIPAGRYGRLFDVEAGVRFSPISHLDLMLGYRHLDLRARDGNDFVRLRLQGPVVGLGFKF